MTTFSGHNYNESINKDENRYTGIFEDTDYKFELKFSKFKMTDPI